MSPDDVRNSDAEVVLDRTDVAIIRALQDDARRTNRDLASTVGLSPSASLERVRRLVSAGVITGFHAQVDPDTVGIGMEVMLMVRLQRHTRNVIEAFQKHCDDLDEVVSWFHLTGASDYVLHVMVRGHDHLRDFLMDSFTTRPEVAQLETHVVLSSRSTHRWPIWRASS